MDDRIEQSLEKILEWAEAGEDFVLEQAPLVAQEIVAWQFWSGITWSIAIAVLAVALFQSSRWLAKQASTFSCSVDSDTGYAFSVAGRLMSMVIGLVAFVPMSFAIKAAVSPRLVILDYLKDIL